MVATHTQELWNFGPTHRFRLPGFVDEIDESVIPKGSQSQGQDCTPPSSLDRVGTVRLSPASSPEEESSIGFRSNYRKSVSRHTRRTERTADSHLQAKTCINFLITQHPFTCQVSRKFSTFVPKSRTRFRWSSCDYFKFDILCGPRPDALVRSTPCSMSLLRPTKDKA